MSAGDSEEAKAKAAYDRKDYATASQHYDKAIENAGNAAGAALFYNNAAALIGLKKFDIAIQQCRQGLAKPGLTIKLKSRLYYGMAVAYAAQGKFEDAMEALKICDEEPLMSEKIADLRNKISSIRAKSAEIVESLNVISDQASSFAPRIDQEDLEECSISVSFVSGADDFYVQLANEKALLQAVEALLAEEYAKLSPLKNVSVGAPCAAILTDGSAPYRAIIKSINDGMAKVLYIDHGNVEERPIGEIKGIGENLAGMAPPLALHCQLINFNRFFGESINVRFAEKCTGLVGKQGVKARFIRFDDYRDVYNVELSDPENDSYHTLLRLERPLTAEELFEGVDLVKLQAAMDQFENRKRDLSDDENSDADGEEEHDPGKAIHVPIINPREPRIPE